MQNAAFKLVHRLRRWSNINEALHQRSVCVEKIFRQVLL